MTWRKWSSHLRTNRPQFLAPLVLAAAAASVVAALLSVAPARADGPGSFIPATATQPRPARTPRPSVSATPKPGRRLVVPIVSGGDVAPPTPTPAPPAPATQADMPAASMETLREKMAAAIAGYAVAGHYAVAVTDLQTGMTASVNGTKPQISGCVVNLFVLMLTLKDVQDGAYPLSKVSGLVESTLWSSNSGTARELYKQTGGGNLLGGVRKVQALIDRLGLTNTLVDHPPGYPYESRGIDGNNWVTAEEVNAGLAALYRGDVLGDPLRSYLLDAMTQVMPGLNYLLGSGATGRVSHKNGWLEENGDWVDNDAGIVRFTRGGREYAYAVTFLAMDVDVHGTDVALGQVLTRMIWQHFSDWYQ